jgi:aminoglycoside 6'-N-acetyltransferase
VAPTEWAIRRTDHVTTRPAPPPPRNNPPIAPTSLPVLNLRPLAEADAAELRRIHATPEVAFWWDSPPAGFPLTDDPEQTRLTIEVDGAIGGMVQFYEELEPKFRHAAIDVFLDPAYHGQGIGAEVLFRMIRHLIDERGHHRITIDPALENVAAVRCYEKVGFKPVGVMRRYEKAEGGGWRDGLLMDLLAGEEREPKR